MGLFWDLIQQSQISQQRERSWSLERRVQELERDLDATRNLLHVLLRRLETELGEDIDGDGKTG
jgi:hypothetical protein